MSYLNRRTFAIISHPDAGKTTLTEKLLLYGKVIQTAGSIKAKKADKHATSDWMAMEKERGISVTSSVMQFDYQHCVINLLDTPGHEDFSEDTYRTLSAVDCALMVIDVAKGVEQRTIKLMAVCRLRDTPIITFINKLDRQGKSPIDLLDEIESVLKITCVPVTWPIGMGQDFSGVYHLLEDRIYLFDGDDKNSVAKAQIINGLDNPLLKDLLDAQSYQQFLEEVDLIKTAMPTLNKTEFLNAKVTPVFFGSAVNNFGIETLLDGFIHYAPPPQTRQAEQRMIAPNESALTGFVFKIQANMDAKHHDRIAFMRLVSGQYHNGIKVRQIRTNKTLKISSALTFMSQKRQNTQTALAGDIIGIHNHGGIQIGDSFSQGEAIKFSGIASFAPELFRVAQLKEPLKAKALHKGLNQLSEEGATQVFRPLTNAQQILGAIGILQFDVVAHRLKYEYGVDCQFQSVAIKTVRWLTGKAQDIAHIKTKLSHQLAIDAKGHLVFLANSSVNLELTMERHPDIVFCATYEH